MAPDSPTSTPPRALGPVAARYRVAVAHPRIGPLVLIALGLVYLAAAQLIQWLNDPNGVGSGLWPAAGITLAALLMLPVRLWAWALAGVFLAEFGGDIASGYGLWPSMGWAIANTAEPLVGACLMRRLGNPRGALTPLRATVVFIGAGAIAGPMVGAGIGSLVTDTISHAPFLDIWSTYVVGDGLGVLIIAPVLLSLRTPGPRRHPLEVVALYASAIIVTVAVFDDTVGRYTETMAYLLIPFFVWAALRHGMRGAAWVALVITLIATTYTASGQGPFTMASGGDGMAVTLLQVFLAVTVSSTLLAASLVSELSDRREVEAALRHRASHDLLTGLPNRSRLAAALDAALDDGERDAALLVCDIDHLKVVNDTIGHAAGDALIAGVAERLTACVRAGDLVSRISGDEFVIVLHSVDPAAVRAMCRRITEAARLPLAVGEYTEVTASLSIGTAMSAPGMTGEELFNNADTALYEAKRLGRGLAVHFDEALSARARRRSMIEADLPRALATGEITAVFQPEIVVDTGEVFGFEALARWHHPEHGAIAPDEFVAAADATGRAGALFSLMLDGALAAQSRWWDPLGHRPVVAVNLSALQLRDPELVDTVRAALARAGAPADTLWLELTESAASDESAEPVLAALAALGVRLALDDFGIGWSSMSRLSQHPWRAIKLDRSFIAPLGDEPGAKAVVTAMIRLAHALGMLVVAEGVETDAQLRCLRALGCDIVQGFMFSTPVSGEDVTRLVDADGRWTGPHAAEGTLTIG